MKTSITWFLVALALLWSAPALAQVPTIRAGETIDVVADHDGQATTSYLLRVQGIDSTPQPQPVVQAGNTVRLSLAMVAVGQAGQAPSDAITVAVVLPDPPAPQPCPYVSPAGVSSTKPIGNDDVRGWNVVDFNALEDVRRHYARMQQLKDWGFDPQVLAIDAVRNRVYIFAPCAGSLP